MKRLRWLPAVVIVLLVGCEYESALVEEARISIDPAVIGLWEPLADPGQKAPKDERMMVLKYSDTEYLIHYPVEKDGWYYRGYAITLGGVACVQLQVIGTDTGPPKDSERALFHVFSYRLTDGQLVIRTINTDLVSDDLKDTEALKRAFLKHKDDKDLFINPVKFKKSV